MAKTGRWHSIKDQVHHDNTVCPDGKAVEPEFRRPGDGDRPLCPVCAKLNAEGL